MCLPLYKYSLPFQVLEEAFDTKINSLGETKLSKLHYKSALKTSNGSMTISEIIQQIKTGTGYVVLPGVCSAEDAKSASEAILDQTTSTGSWRAELGPRHHRVRDLLFMEDMSETEEKATIQLFDKLVTLPEVMAIVGQILGKGFKLGAFTGNVLLNNCPSGHVHRDYPYNPYDEFKRLNLDLNKPPDNYDSLSLQLILALDPMTLDNGATAILPGTQLWKLGRGPESSKQFWSSADRMVANAGTAILSHPCVLHASGQNRSGKARIALLGQYLSPKVHRMLPALNNMDQTDVWDKLSDHCKGLLQPEDTIQETAPPLTNRNDNV